MTILDYNCEIVYDKLKPDGVMRKKLDTTLLNQLGWKNKDNFNKSIIETYNSFLKNLD